MTEIPEHLLKRSKDRRAALGLGGGDDAGEAKPAAAAATPAPAAAAAAPAAPAGPAGRKAAATPAAPPPPKPDSPVVAAYKSRRKVPFWAMGALGLLPIWGIMYARALTEAPEEVVGPLAAGATAYNSCSSCHGAGGEGGVGRPLSNGDVLMTFPHIEDQIRFVHYGTAGYQAAGIDSYGNPDREGGPHLTASFGVMPVSGEGGLGLSEADILAVVCHERYTLGGADPASEEYATEYETWCSETSPIYAALEGGEMLATIDQAGVTDTPIIPITDGPQPGNPPGDVAGG